MSTDIIYITGQEIILWLCLFLSIGIVVLFYFFKKRNMKK